MQYRGGNVIIGEFEEFQTPAHETTMPDNDNTDIKQEEVLDNPPINYVGWRVKPLPPDSPLNGEKKAGVGGRLIFNDERKSQYLEFLEKYGKKDLCCKMVGIANSTLYDHLDIDPEFAEMVEVALRLRSQRIVQMLEEQALNGHNQPIFDKDGNEVGQKKVYESNLRGMMMKRHDKAYSESNAEGTTINNNNQPVGAVIVPAGVPAEQWEELYGEKAKGTYRPSTTSPKGQPK